MVWLSAKHLAAAAYNKFSSCEWPSSMKCIIVSFDFVFVLFLMEKIMKTTDVLCQTLQRKSFDILNAMDCVSNTKLLLHGLRNDGWEPLLEEVTMFCDKHRIEIPDINYLFI